jgi:hypothetical protein
MQCILTNPTSIAYDVPSVAVGPYLQKGANSELPVTIEEVCSLKIAQDRGMTIDFSRRLHMR